MDEALAPELEEWLGAVVHMAREPDRERPGQLTPDKPLLIAALMELLRAGALPTPETPRTSALESVSFQLRTACFPERPAQPFPVAAWLDLVDDGVLQRDVAELRPLVSRLLQPRAHWGPVGGAAACPGLPPAVHALLVSDPVARDQVQEILDVLLEECGASARLAEVCPPEPAAPPQGPLDALREGMIEDYLVQHWERTPFGVEGVVLHRNAWGERIGHHLLTPVGRISLLGFQPSRSTWWVIELKKGREDELFLEEHQRAMNWVAARMARAGEKVHGAVVAQEVSQILFFSALATPDVSVWLVDESLCPKRVAGPVA